MLSFIVSRSNFKLFRSSLQLVTRHFSLQNAVAAAKLPPRPVISEQDIQETFLKGSGPGGQKIVCWALLDPHIHQMPRLMFPRSRQNKTYCAVQLTHLPSGTVVKSQATRSRDQNRKIARRLLAEKIEAAERGPESRTALKAEIKKKKKASKNKKARRKYRALHDGAEDGAEDEERDESTDAEDDSDEAAEEAVKEDRVKNSGNEALQER